MSDATEVRAYGLRFDQVAEAYDEHRRGYPDEVIDAVCQDAGLGPGDPVLEVGCGTGQLTAALVDRGFSVVAVDPGRSMIERARRRLGRGVAEFVCGRFEDVVFPARRFAAIFSGSAFHWVDPQVSWAKAASLLEPRGTLALVQYCGGSDETTMQTELELYESLQAIAPDIASSFPKPRTADAALEGARRRSANVSEVWSWIAQHRLTVTDAAELYDDARVRATPVAFQWTPEQLNAHLRTTSLSLRLGPERTAALEAATHRVAARHGGRLRLTELAVAVIAERSSGDATNGEAHRRVNPL